VSRPSLPSLESPQTGGFIPPHGGYENLLSYQKARIVYDATVYFTARFLDKKDRTCDQMVQAARSGKQNIVEGSQISGTSKELELKLTNVARASLEELRDDYRDFLRTRGLAEWTPEHPYTQRLRRLNRTPSANYDTFRKGAQLVWCPTNSATQHADQGLEGTIENGPAFQGWVKIQWGPSPERTAEITYNRFGDTAPESSRIGDRSDYRWGAVRLPAPPVPDSED
jgi:four helix bundle protein